jgi:hypothetical protein
MFECKQANQDHRNSNTLLVGHKIMIFVFSKILDVKDTQIQMLYNGCLISIRISMNILVHTIFFAYEMLL